MWTDILFLFVVLFANIIQVLTGFAGTVIAMPISIKLIGVTDAKLILNIVAMVTCLVIAIKDYRHINLRECLFIFLFVGIGFVFGFLLDHYVSIDHQIFNYVYGSIIILIGLYFLVFGDRHDFPLVVLIPLLLLAGVIHELFVSGGPLVVMYASARLKQKDQFRATLCPIWVILNAFLLVDDVVQQHFTAENSILLGISFVMVVLSYLIGHWIYKKVSLPLFMKITYSLLIVSGVCILL